MLFEDHECPSCELNKCAATTLLGVDFLSVSSIGMLPAQDEEIEAHSNAVLNACSAPSSRPFAEKYAADQEAFFVDYALAHKKLSENGAKWGEGGPVALQEA